LTSGPRGQFLKGRQSHWLRLVLCEASVLRCVARLAIEPFDPLSGGVSAREQPGAIGAVIKGSSPEHREHAVLLIVLDQFRRQPEILDAVVTRRPERDEGIERQPRHRVQLPRLGKQPASGSG
jgi:hypothetical protein